MENEHNSKPKIKEANGDTPPIEREDASVHHQITENKSYNSEQALVDRINRSDRWMICLTAMIAVAGLVSAIIFWRQLSVMSGQLTEMQSSSRQTERTIAASNRIAEATAQSVIVSNNLVAATTEAVAASKQLADETAHAVAASKQLVAAAENSNVTSAKLAESAAKSNELSHQALLVAQRPFMIPINVDLSKIPASMLGLGILAIPDADKTIAWLASVKWENSGNTPTRDLTITTYCLFSSEAMTEPYNVAKIKDFSIIKDGISATKDYAQILYGREQKLLFGPKQTNNAGACIRTGLEVMLNSLLPGVYHHYVFGSARYRDRIEGKYIYRTDFCFEVILTGNPEAEWMKAPAGAEIKSTGVLCASHNCADDECEEQDREAAAHPSTKPPQAP